MLTQSHQSVNASCYVRWQHILYVPCQHYSYSAVWPRSLRWITNLWVSICQHRKWIWTELTIPVLNAADMKAELKLCGWQSHSCHFGFQHVDRKLVDTVYKDVDKVLTSVRKSGARVAILTPCLSTILHWAQNSSVTQPSVTDDWMPGAPQV